MGDRLLRGLVAVLQAGFACYLGAGMVVLPTESIFWAVWFCCGFCAFGAAVAAGENLADALGPRRTKAK